MKILGLFNLNDEHDYSTMNSKIDDCEKYIDGKLDHFLYEENEDRGILVNPEYDIKDELSPHYVIRLKSDYDKLLDKYPEYEAYLDIISKYPDKDIFTIYRKDTKDKIKPMFWYQNPEESPLNRIGGAYNTYEKAPEYTAEAAAKIMTYKLKNKSNDWEVIPIQVYKRGEET